ncbi:MAG TPA: hypothetical protein PLB00_08590 [Pseudomonadota bacterium]|jgi:hypothetical protein|nr:hypothetical protein [Pseudomonadota bacterium]
MKFRMFSAAALLACVSTIASAADVVPVRIENRGLPVVVKQFRDGVQCDLSQLGRSHYVIGDDVRYHTRRHLDRDLVAGEPVELVFVRNVFRPARTGIPGGSDQIGVRARMVPEAGMEYRVRVDQAAMRLDAIVESRAAGSNDAFARVPTVVSYDPQSLCVTGVRGSVAAR